MGAQGGGRDLAGAHPSYDLGEVLGQSIAAREKGGFTLVEFGIGETDQGDGVVNGGQGVSQLVGEHRQKFILATVVGPELLDQPNVVDAQGDPGAELDRQPQIIFTIAARRLIGPRGTVEHPLVTIEDRRIIRIESLSSRDHQRVAATHRFPEATLVPAYVDIHIHGCAGHDVMEAMQKDGYKGHIGLETHIFDDTRVAKANLSMKEILRIVDSL